MEKDRGLKILEPTTNMVSGLIEKAVIEGKPLLL